MAMEESSFEDEGLEQEEPLSYSERPDWQDIEPLVVDDGQAVVSIQYKPEHSEALAYFRAIMAKGEHSRRALELTKDMIGFNQADYTAWEWRWQCLQALGADLTQEYTFTDSIMHDNAKNYQLWNHRRKCALALGPSAAARELQVAADALNVDEKNYHAWAHRQAIVQAFGGELWAQELAFTESMLERDVRNNSAWNQRMLIVRREVGGALGLPLDPAPGADAAAGGARTSAGPGAAAAVAPGVLQPEGELRALLMRELEYVAEQVASAPRNESVWNYLRGLFALPGLAPHALGASQEVYTICTEALLQAPSCPPALDTLSEYYMHLACLAGHRLPHLPSHSPAGAAGAAAGGGAGPAGAAAAGQQPMQQQAAQPQQQEQQQQQEGAQAGGPPESEAVREAREAVQHAARSALIVLNHLLIADPIRTMYWNQRQHDVEALLASLGVPLNDGPQPEPFIPGIIPPM